jgi:hypothetical protein
MEFYEREKTYKETYDGRKEKLRNLMEEEKLKELKNKPKIDTKSLIIIKKNNLDKKKPLHMRTEEIKEIKKMKIASIKKEVDKQKNNYNYNPNFNKFKSNESSNFENNTINNFYSINTNNNITNTNTNTNTNNFIINPYEIKGLKRSNSTNLYYNSNNNNEDNLNINSNTNEKNKNSNNNNNSITMSNSNINNNNFNTWYKEKENWNNKKFKKIQSLKEQKKEEIYSLDSKENTFTPIIDKNSKKILSNKINNNKSNKKSNNINYNTSNSKQQSAAYENSNKKKEKEEVEEKEKEKSSPTIFEKLYSLNSAKKEKIKILEQKYKPNFKPVINKLNFFNESSNLGIGFCGKTMKSFCIEDKDDDFINFESELKNKKIKSIASIPNNNVNINNDKGNLNNLKSNESDNNNNLNNKNFFRNKEEKNRYYARFSKGFSPNKDLIIKDDLRFINDLKKLKN